MAAEHVRIHRHTVGSCFTIIPNVTLQDEGLSWGARGLLAYLLSLPQDWTIHMTQLIGCSPDGKQRFYSLRRELEAKGFLRGRRLRDERGLMTGVCWEVTDMAGAWPEPIADFDTEPENPVGSPYSGKPECGENPVTAPYSGKPESGKPEGGKPDSGKPESGNPPTTKNTSDKEQIDKGLREKEAHPPAAAIWDSQAMQFQMLPWEDGSRRLNPDFVEWLTDLWAKGKSDRADARSMAASSIRRARRDETAFLATRDRWEQFQQHQAEQAQRIEAERIAAEEAAERARWLG